MLAHYGIPDRLITALRKIYEDTFTVVDFNGHKSRPVRISRGVQQGGPEAPDLFNIFINLVFAEALEEMGDTGVKLTFLANGQLYRPDDVRQALRAGALTDSLRGLLIADDMTLVAELDPAAPDDVLQLMLDAVARACRRCKLDFNLTKNQLLVINPKADVAVPTLMLGGVPVPRVPKARYLGAIFDESGTLDAEINARISAATNSGRKLMTTIFKRRSVSLKTKLALFKALVESYLFYGCTSWPTAKQHIDKLEACRMKYLRQIAKPLPGWRFDKDRPYLLPSNERVLKQCGMEPVKVVLRRRRLAFLGARRVLFGQMEGPRRRGTPPVTLRSVLRDDFCSPAPHANAGWSTNLAADATGWRKLVAGTSAERLNR